MLIIEKVNKREGGRGGERERDSNTDRHTRDEDWRWKLNKECGQWLCKSVYNSVIIILATMP